jgi:hypothetical protein
MVMAAPVATADHPVTSASAGVFTRRGHLVVETSLAEAVGIDGMPGPAVLVAEAGIAECVLEDGVDPARLAPGVRALAASGWAVTVLVPARRMGAAHWGLRGSPAMLQAWWPGPGDTIRFGDPQVP